MGIESKAIYKLSYGLYVLTTADGGRDNGCIINTAEQLTSEPMRVSVAVNKNNYTNEMIHRSGIFNVSVLTEQTPFSVIKNYGFASGRDTDKFASADMPRSENGIIYLPGCANAYISVKVTQTVEFESHTLFIGEVTDAKVLSGENSLTYSYYLSNIKPKPQQTEQKKKGYICKVCGYVYEGDELPADFVCPVCKHGADAFEPIG